MPSTPPPGEGVKRAAQYLRMSTEHQRYSIEHQKTAIALYATANAFEIVATYADEGVSAQPLTDQQKAAIAEVRTVYDARIAEQDILQQSAMKNLMGGDPAEVDEISRRFRRERERLASEGYTNIEALRMG